MDIIIADDAELLLNRLEELIAQVEGINLCYKAMDAPTALVAIERFKPDAVILDINLPGGNGLQILETVKQWENPPVVIVYTFYAYPQHRNRALAHGADFFLSKSNDYEKIIPTLIEIRDRLLNKTASLPAGRVSVPGK
jgi:DNA-binding NarL/FixJ family response regulator